MWIAIQAATGTNGNDNTMLITLRRATETALATAATATGAAVGSAAATVAVPVAVSAVGFGSTGIAGGSYAAVWMSSVAIANGGGVASGSTVAVLQSIGAAGLGTLGLPVMIGGAAVGAAAVGTTYAVYRWGYMPYCRL
jgi:hypothetical protein